MRRCFACCFTCSDRGLGGFECLGDFCGSLGQFSYSLSYSSAKKKKKKVIGKLRNVVISNFFSTSMTFLKFIVCLIALHRF